MNGRTLLKAAFHRCSLGDTGRTRRHGRRTILTEFAPAHPRLFCGALVDPGPRPFAVARLIAAPGVVAERLHAFRDEHHDVALAAERPKNTLLTRGAHGSPGSGTPARTADARNSPSALRVVHRDHWRLRWRTTGHPLTSGGSIP